MSNQFNNTGDTTLGPYNATTPNTEDVCTRTMVPVPHGYTPLVLGKEFTPRELWEQLATAIINNGVQGKCQHVLTWIRVAAALCTNPADNTIQPPANHAGLLDVTYPIVQEDPHIARHRWETLALDLPALTGKTLPPSDQLMQLFGALHCDQAVDRAAAKARRPAEKLDKLPSTTRYKTVAVDWMQFCAVTNEADLPPIYHSLANADKTKHISLLHTAVCDRTRHAGAAPTNQIVPVISKELKDMIFGCLYGVPPHKINDLTIGLQPFAVGFYLGDNLGHTVDLYTTNYEQMYSGLTAPRLGEQSTFFTKEVEIPEDLFTAGIMLATTSVVVNVMQGVNHPFATAFCGFCIQQWPPICTTLNLTGRHNPDIWTTVIPRMMRWIQTRMVFYFHQVMLQGVHHTPLPAFHELTHAVTLREIQYAPQPP